jgi:hypothetical protein
MTGIRPVPRAIGSIRTITITRDGSDFYVDDGHTTHGPYRSFTSAWNAAHAIKRSLPITTVVHIERAAAGI